MLFPVIIIIAGISGMLIAQKIGKKVPEPSSVKQINPSIEKTKKLQQYINSLLPNNYPKLSIDGIWGPKTENAFKYLLMSNISTAEKKQLLDQYYKIRGHHFILNQTKKLSYPSEWYILAADQLYKAMNRPGTDVATIMKIFYHLRTKNDWLSLQKVFDWRQCTSNCWGFPGGTLMEWLKEDLSDNPNTWKYVQNKIKALK
jgi:hypothetical protein